MSDIKEILAIIPTRGGSTGLPKKNIRMIAGKPLLSYMLETAKKSQLLTKIIFTTDNDDIAEAAMKIDGITVQRHDPKLSFSGQPTFGVVQYTLNKYIEEASTPFAVLLLRVTTPLCESYDIDNAINLLSAKRGKATSVLGVVESDIHPKRTYEIQKDGYLIPHEETPETKFPLPRQVFNKVYIRNGAIYATFPEIVLKGSMWGEKPIPYIMPKERSININDEFDFMLAEKLLKKKC